METLRIIVTILASLLGTSVILMLWLASRNRKLKEKQENKLIAITDKIEDSQDRLDKAITVLVEDTNANLKLCKLRHEMLDHIIDKHSKRLEEIGREIHDIEISLAKTNTK
jgi:hypothetical protein